MKQLFQQDLLFSSLLAVITSCLTSPRVEYIDWKVIFCLFNLMAIILALGKLKIWDAVSLSLLTWERDQRRLSLLLIMLTFVSSMFITNDVALITFVPLTILIARRAGFDPGYMVILQAMAANIGSSLTPIGNPQNLFLFAHYNLTLKQLLHVMLPFVGLGIIWLVVLNLRTPSRPLEFDLKKVQIGNPYKIVAYAALFVAVVLSVLRVFDYRLVSAVVILTLLALDRDVLVKVDYALLATFACFFIFIGNISHLGAVTQPLTHYFSSSSSVYFSSILFSQAISNVPCAILLANFTKQWEAVLLGVNVGGIGSLIASLASIIAYRYYVNSYSRPRYLYEFLSYNLITLAILTGLVYYLVLA